MTSKARFKPGDRVKIVQYAVITDVSDAHGLAYQVQFPARDYVEPRILWVDADEIHEGEATAVRSDIL